MSKQWHDGVRVPVAWGDMDAFRHVNNTVYIRWFETARIAYFRDLKLGEPTAEITVGPILASISCNFRKPVIFPDVIHTQARVSSCGRTSFVMQHQVTSEKHGGAIVAEGEGVIVIVDFASGKPVPLPEDLRQLIEKQK